MGRNYSIDGSDTNTDNTTILALTSTSAVRPKIYDIMWGSAATPAEQSSGYQLERYTAAGTSTSVVPQRLDPGDPQPGTATAGEAHSVEPTYTAAAILLRIPLHQRASWRWVANEGKELVLPATAANGIGFVAAVPTTAFNVEVTMHFEE